MNVFRKLEIIPLALQYILSLMLPVVKNKNLLISNSGNHDINTRRSNNFYLFKTFSSHTLLLFHRGVFSV
jgi:hypothetical protein